MLFHISSVASLWLSWSLEKKLVTVIPVESKDVRLKGKEKGDSLLKVVIKMKKKLINMLEPNTTASIQVHFQESQFFSSFNDMSGNVNIHLKMMLN